ncbi:copper resistance CopC/CopD family protein [Methylorubrum extorquens]|jgi:copper transport protein|uniref:copper resistance CopC/CopD family protein n=1 Tax=Methylorubrum extorquens TaxID=408 RepID=UPI001EE563D9|nr:CopD family protein [Methylorubrum extorquens]MCG5248398.1 CopD family protein [Methylorubrum extorquens]
MRGWAIVATFLVAVLSWTAATVPARAHATLVASEPADGAVLSVAPARLILSFNEAVSPLVMRLASPSKKMTTLQATAEREASLVVALPSGLSEGTHVLSWRVVSLDGHPVGGTITFSVGAPSPGSGPTTKNATDPFVTTSLWAFRVVFYAGLFIGVGGSFFLTWLAPGIPAEGRISIVAVLVTGLLSIPLLVGLQGLDALDLPLQELAGRETWAVGFGTSFGATAIIAALAMTAGIAALAFRSHGGRGLALCGVLLAGLALALSGHASSAAPQWLTRPAVFAHAVSLAFWLGSLVPLGVILMRDATPERVLIRFSRAVPWAIVPLIASGVILVVVQVGQPRALLTTAYGEILIVKLALVAALLTIAAWNRLRLTPAVINGGTVPRRALARLITIEVAVVVVVLGLVATWRFTPPPRALAAASAKPAHVHIHTSGAMADVTFEPGRAGMVQASITLAAGDFDRLEAKEVLLTLTNRAAGIEAISRPATKTGEAGWQVRQIPVPTGGRWSVQVEILINDFEKQTLEGHIDFQDGM